MPVEERGLSSRSRFGIRFVASPRRCAASDRSSHRQHAGSAGTHLSGDASQWVVAVGDCMQDGSLFCGSYACLGGVAEVIPVNLHIHGCPPSPLELLEGLLALLRVEYKSVSLCQGVLERTPGFCEITPEYANATFLQRPWVGTEHRGFGTVALRGGRVWPRCRKLPDRGPVSRSALGDNR